MFKKTAIYVILFNASLGSLLGQEVVTGLQINSHADKNNQMTTNRKGLNATDTLGLPFFDDFSGRSATPDIRKWTDNNVFINNTYSDKQVTAGVATFDALNAAGSLYPDANSYNFKADELTSQPINLKFIQSDNIFLSFFYQAGGLSDPPEATDSLTLQFFAPVENAWHSVWSSKGTQDTRMKPAIIKIDNGRYLQKGFRFRFINYASLSPNVSDPSMIGNCDIWNIDYVLINKNRNPADTAFADVAYTLPLRSLLKTYEAMPWKQFQQVYLQEMGSSVALHYRNNDANTRNVTRSYDILDVYRNTTVYSNSAGATNILPLTSIDYKAGLVYTFASTNPDSALFRIKAILKTDNFDPKENDTLVYYQVFQNYFAYDDGSSEGGYGVNGLGSRNAMVAYRFRSYIQDTLRAIRICFNDSYLESNKRAFDLMVWNDNNGIPGDILFTKEEVMVEQGQGINGFYTYAIPEGVVINGNFYVGWRQRSETFLNAGYDINTYHSGRQLYWINGDWRESQVEGSIMIRPVVGSPLIVTAVKDPEQLKTKFRFWPNPAGDYINIEQGDLLVQGRSVITITDMNGRELMRTQLTERVDISSLQKGMYIIVITNNGQPVGYNRLIKIR
jgi:hypothetical protein